MFTRIKLLRNYLIYQIFFSFMITFALILAIGLALPNFDAREFNPIEEKTQDYFALESRLTEQGYNLDEVFRRSLSVSSTNGFDVILLEPETGQITGLTEHQLGFLQAFISKANDPKSPLKRRFGNLEFYGPFEVNSPQHRYHQYFLQEVKPQEEFLNTIFDSPWIMLFMLLIVSTPIIWWQSHRISKPVKELALTANAVSTGNLSVNTKLEQEPIAELRRLGSNFNQMIQSLQRLRAYQQRLISDISHELKTPLTRMQLAISLLRRRQGESSELTRIENEIGKLDQMIQDLLALSRRNLDQHIGREIFPIHKIWEPILEDAQFEFGESEIALNIDHQILFPEKHFINGNLVILGSAVENVLRNAKKYAKQKVKITTYLERNNLCILIDDDGQGVPDDKYQDIFRPFYRIGDDRARQTGGTGLGLAIVANAVENHHGFVNAEKSPLGGLRVKIILPLWIE